MGLYSNYIKEIEEYFLGMKGRGVMLSSRDYNLAREWEMKGIPMNTVMKAISLAIEHSQGEIKTLYNCKKYVEELHNRKSKNPRTVSGKNNQIEHLNHILRKIDELLKQETRQSRRDHYAAYREEIINITKNNYNQIFEQLQLLEDRFFDSFFESLDKTEKKSLIKQAEDMIPTNTGFLNEEVKNDTIRSLRDELIQKQYKLVNIFDYD